MRLQNNRRRSGSAACTESGWLGAAGWDVDMWSVGLSVVADRGQRSGTHIKCIVESSHVFGGRLFVWRLILNVLEMYRTTPGTVLHLPEIPQQFQASQQDGVRG